MHFYNVSFLGDPDTMYIFAANGVCHLIQEIIEWKHRGTAEVDFSKIEVDDIDHLSTIGELQNLTQVLRISKTIRDDVDCDLSDEMEILKKHKIGNCWCGKPNHSPLCHDIQHLMTWKEI